MDYIGIGRAIKTGNLEDYRALARQNALSDLASEIQVNVSSNSLLYTLEHDQRFSEQYSEQIRTRTDLDLEGFEAYAAWEDGKEYWLYYRLNKNKYEQWKKEKKSKAIQSAYNDRALARKARSVGNIALATEYFIKSLEDLKAYWGEDNFYLAEEKEGSIDKVALIEIMDMRNAFKLKSDHEHIALNIDNGFEETVSIRSMVDGRNTEAVPFVYRQGKGENQSRDSDLLKIKVRPGTEPRETLSVEVDPFKELRARYKDPAYGFLRALLKGVVYQVDINVEYPPMAIISRQRMGDGESKECTALRSAMMMALSKNNVAMDENSKFQILIDARSKDGGINQGFQVVYTDVTIQGKDLRSDEVHFEQRFDSVKGVHSNLESAQDKSLQKATEMINQSLLKAILEAMF